MYYDGANWKWEDEMNKDEIIADLNKIIATLKGEDKKEPCHHWGRYNNEEKKEERKLADIFNGYMQRSHEHVKCFGVSPTSKYSEDAAKAAIDAVIECYEEWIRMYKFPGPIAIEFPEYLKEKML